MAKKEELQEFNGKKGVWRTIGGRRVFIAEGQNINEAMKESGKFNNIRSKNAERNQKKNYKDAERQLLDDYTQVETEDLKGYYEDFKKQGKEKFADRIQTEINKREGLTDREINQIKTQKSLQKLVDDGKAEDITRLSNEETKALGEKEGRLEAVKVTKGVYGMNGALLKSKKTGRRYVITARNTNLFYWV